MSGLMLETRFRKPQSISTEDRRKIIEKIINYLSQRQEIIFAYLYGSFGRDEEFFRDIDIALFVKESILEFDFESDISYELTIITGQQVEVRVINKAPVSFQMAVLRAGKFIFSQDEEKRTDFIQYVGKRYIDYSHLREIAIKS
ncbi:MAG: nucleotidyltransferase domain-containing protein [bacterium]